MKKIALLAAAATLIAAPAFAQSTQTVTVTTNVAGQCGLGNQSGGGEGGYTSSVSFADITDENGFLDTDASVLIGFGNVWCNSAATLSMVPSNFNAAVEAQDSSSFVDDLNLIVDGDTGTGGSIMAYFGGRVATSESPLNNISIGSAFETGTGRFQQARVTLGLPAGTAGNDRPVAGAWTGTVTLTVSPS